MFGDLSAALGIAFTYFTIIYVTGLGGLFSERSGIVNIGLEGMMIIGTVTGSWGTFFFTSPDHMGWGLPWGPIMGILIGMIAGALFASIHALATVTFKVDQIVSGVVINLVAVGLARFLSSIFFGQATQSDSGQPHLHVIDIPGLSSLPLGLGRAFTGLSPMVIVAFLLVFPVTYSLYKTRWGLRLRSCGENPEAARALGVRVAPLRYQGVMLSGALAGFAGAFLAIEVNLSWNEGQTQGLGFIALAALILSNWNPKRLMVAAMIFGFAQAIPYRLADAPIIRLIPPEFVRMTPVHRHDRRAGRVRRQGQTPGGRGQGVRRRRRALGSSAGAVEDPGSAGTGDGRGPVPSDRPPFVRRQHDHAGQDARVAGQRGERVGGPGGSVPDEGERLSGAPAVLADDPRGVRGRGADARQRVLARPDERVGDLRPSDAVPVVDQPGVGGGVLIGGGSDRPDIVGGTGGHRGQ